MLLNYTKQTELIGPLWGGEQEYMVIYLLKTYFCISVNALQNTANTEVKYTLNITYFFPGEWSRLTLHVYSVV
jgi:hypothetical protein